MQFNNRSFLLNIAPVTRHLLIINIIVWLATFVFQSVGIVDLNRWLGLYFWKGSYFNVFQFFTSMFMHADFFHLFVNMFMLWMFGSLVERVMGSKRYLFYYISCGLAAGLAQELVWQLSWESLLLNGVSGPAGATVTDIINAINSGNAAFTMNDFYNGLVVIGASGAVFGILLAIGMLFPNMPMYVIPFPFPIKAKWLVLCYGLFELFFGVTGRMDHVAHFAHLGGMIAGIFIILYWKHNGTLNRNGYY